MTGNDTDTERVTAYLDAVARNHPGIDEIDMEVGPGDGPGQWSERPLNASDLRTIIERLRALERPATWTAPDGTVLDLARQIFDLGGDAWTLVGLPPLTVAMVDGDLDSRTLPELFERYGPLTNEGVEL